MAKTFSIPPKVLDAVRRMGYSPDTSMADHVTRWWQWYVGETGWYDREEQVDGRRYRIRRHSLRPARRVCREWASAILDDDATALVVTGAGDDPAGLQGLLDAWASETRFLPSAQRCLERAFATGTGALALWFEVSEGGARIRARRYDARMVLPLSWDDEQVSECAFCTSATSGGRPVTQLQAHLLDRETGTYHVVTRLFREDGEEVRDPSVIADFDTLSTLPTFALMRPAIDNTFSDCTAMGQSVFADAIDAVKAVDNAFDSMQREIDATKVKVFMTDDLLDVATDASGRARAIPMSPENTIVRKLAGNGSQQMLEVFSPEIRIDPLVRALNVALAELGDLTGFGQNYLRFDKDGGVKTAREVSSDNSAFARTIRKHENELRPQLEGLLATMLACQRALNGWPVPDGAGVRVEFDDSIVADTESQKATAMAEVAAGVMGAWEYRARFFGEDEDVARRMAGEAGALPAPAWDAGTMA